MLQTQHQNQTVMLEKMNEMEKKMNEMEKSRKVVVREMNKTPYKPPRSSSNNDGPPTLVIGDDPNALSDEEVRRLLESSGKSVERGAKALVIKNVELFDGKNPFDEWFKSINVKLIAGDTMIK